MAYDQDNEDLQHAMYDLETAAAAGKKPDAAETFNPEALASDINNRKDYLQDMRARLRKQLGKDGGVLQNIDFSPMLSWADHILGTNAASKYVSPEKRETESNRLQSIIDKEDQKLSQTQMDYLKMKSLEASKLDANKLREMLMARSNDWHNRLADQRDDRMAMAMGGKIDSDDLVKQSTQQNQNLAKALGTLKAGGMLTPQILSEVENDLAAALSGKGAATDHVRKNVEMGAWQRKLANMKQALTSSPQGVNMPEYNQYLQDVIGRLQEANNLNIQSRLSSIKNGYGNLSSGKTKQVMNDKVAGYQQQASPNSPSTDSDEDAQALAWARANPNDPHAQEILKLHGAN